MKIKKYDFNGIEIENAVAEIRTVIVNMPNNIAVTEIDIKLENGAVIDRKNINFAISWKLKDSLVDAIGACFDYNTGQMIKDVSAE